MLYTILTCCIFQVVVVNTFSTTSASLAQLRRDESLEKFLKLPEKWSVNKAIKNEYQQHIKTLSIDHPLCLGVTRKQRTSELIHAAEIGNVTRLKYCYWPASMSMLLIYIGFLVYIIQECMDI